MSRSYQVMVRKGVMKEAVSQNSEEFGTDPGYHMTWICYFGQLVCAFLDFCFFILN